MNLADLVALLLRANKAGRTTLPEWEEDTTEADARKFTDQLARMLPDHCEEIRRLAFPPTLRAQLWCDTFGCDAAHLVTVPREYMDRPSPPCKDCGVPLNRAPVTMFIYSHPNLFDVWTLEAPALEAAEAKFCEVWTERTSKGGEFSHLTNSTFDQGKVQTQEDYEAP